MTNEEARKTIEIAKAEVEWNYPMEYQEAFDIAIDCIEKQIPKSPKEYTLYTESDEEVKYEGCPRCKAILHRSHYFLKICSCGQKLEVE